ncbi:hypothetical protein NliqN6_2909 [Naganishia liquefaciens]|uniref:Uncharacterized protein n=1 Tax=Naganishia liquefaciens TaxID=104408 RepID=A0A8H3TSR5_9TREE|nr:hypothetical protein NliqN6_2909 [Naganishia liquefaciens]
MPKAEPKARITTRCSENGCSFGHCGVKNHRDDCYTRGVISEADRIFQRRTAREAQRMLRASMTMRERELYRAEMRKIDPTWSPDLPEPVNPKKKSTRAQAQAVVRRTGTTSSASAEGTVARSSSTQALAALEADLRIFEAYLSHVNWSPRRFHPMRERSAGLQNRRASLAWEGENNGQRQSQPGGHQRQVRR